MSPPCLVWTLITKPQISGVLFTMKVLPNPRRAAGSTGVFYWLRLCRCTKGKKQHENLKICCPLLTLEVIATVALSCCRKPQRSGGCRQSGSRERHRLPGALPTDPDEGFPHPVPR